MDKTEQTSDRDRDVRPEQQTKRNAWCRNHSAVAVSCSPSLLQEPPHHARHSREAVQTQTVATCNNLPWQVHMVPPPQAQLTARGSTTSHIAVVQRLHNALSASSRCCLPHSLSTHSYKATQPHATSHQQQRQQQQQLCSAHLTKQRPWQIFSAFSVRLGRQGSEASPSGS